MYVRSFLLLLFTALISAGSTIARADEFKPTAQQEFVPSGAKLERVWSDGDFTEGPTLAGDGAILFSDIGNSIMRYDPQTGKTTVFREPSGKANGLMFDRKGRLLACEGAGGGNRRVSITELDGTVRTLADRYDGNRFNSPNDLAIGPRGGVYFTDPRYGGDEPRDLEFEGVFYISPDGKVRLATRDVEKPNGILVAADGKTVFVADNNSKADGNHHLVAFDVGADGTLTNKRMLWDIGPNRRGIDGMTLDRDGNLYATAGRKELAGIYVLSPQGKQLAFLPTPGDPTNCVFGGKDRRDLYITAACVGTPKRFGLYRIHLPKPGFVIFPK